MKAPCNHGLALIRLQAVFDDFKEVQDVVPARFYVRSKNSEPSPQDMCFVLKGNADPKNEFHLALVMFQTSTNHYTLLKQM